MSASKETAASDAKDWATSATEGWAVSATMEMLWAMSANKELATSASGKDRAISVAKAGVESLKEIVHESA